MSSRALGDVWVLESGGRVSGKLLNVDRRQDESYEVELFEGGVLSLPLEQVREVIRQKPDELEYERLAPTFDDTVEGQWEASEWCRKRSLKRQREHHLRRVIELQPDHAKAWAALGYTQVKGEWKRRNEVAEDNGLRFHKGKWRLPQEIELIENHQHTIGAQLDWRNKIAKWLQVTRGRDRAAVEAHQQLAAIRDPLAVPALTLALFSERRPAYRLFLVELLDEINTPEAHHVVLRTTLIERHAEVAHAAMDRVVKRKLPSDVEFYCRALNDRDNFAVNRAGHVLGRIGDYSCVLPLINALQTRNLMLVSGGSQYVYEWWWAVSADGKHKHAEYHGHGRTLPPTYVWMTASNEEVRAALFKIAGADFGFEVPAWRQWYVTWNAQRGPQFEARRAP